MPGLPAPGATFTISIVIARVSHPPIGLKSFL
jgi:hypothetical protein